MSAKYLAPYFGTSLYVWSAVMAATLMALALGYFYGGLLSEKNNKQIILFRLAIAGGLLMMLMPFSIRVSLAIFGYADLIYAVIASSIVLITPPLFIMGAISPLIISIVSENALEKAGLISGRIYAISTLGGILFTFLFGFYIIPNYGLKIPSFITGFLFVLLPLFLIIKKEKKYTVPLWLLFGLAISAYYTFKTKDNAYINVLSKKEGMYGQVMVADFKNKNNVTERILLANNYVQTYKSTDTSLNRYFDIHQSMFNIISNNFAKESNILSLGLGGGIITQKLYEKGYQHIEACELDKYIYEAAVKYFGFSEKIKVSIDDARHYINLLQHHYDILIIDVFKGEEPASHVITLQSLEKIKKHLNNNALLIFNTAGYLESNLGKGNKSLINTLQHADFKVAIMPQGYNINIEDQRNLLVIASLSEVKIVEAKKYFTEKEINLNNLNLASAAILSDEIPNTEKLFAASAMQWRRLNFKYALIMFDN